MRVKQRATRQLAAMLDVLTASTDHPTATQVFERVRGTMPRVSLGTVYRNLDKLRVRGCVKVVWGADRVARYDATLGDHDHFVCQACGRVIDLESLPRQLDVSGLERAGFVVQSHFVGVHGICQRCARGAE